MTRSLTAAVIAAAVVLVPVAAGAQQQYQPYQYAPPPQPAQYPPQPAQYPGQQGPYAPPPPAVPPPPARPAPVPVPREKTLIVFDVMPEKNVNRSTTNLLTEIVLDKVTKLRKFKVVGQKDLAKMLSWEQNKQLTGCSDTSCLVQIAGAMGADFYIEGSAGAVGDNYVITLKLIDASNVSVSERDTRVVQRNENVMIATVMQMVDTLFKIPSTGQPQIAYAPVPQPQAYGQQQPPQAYQQPSPGSPPPANPPGWHRHDGFFLRMSLGFGYAMTKASSGTANVAIKGAAGVFDFGLGYSLVDNLSLSFDLLSIAMTNPTIESGGQSSSTNNVSASTIGFGGGLNYFFMPANVYLGIMFGGASMSISQDNTEVAKSDIGYIFQLAIGKEWWVSENWGLGMAVDLLYTRIPETDGSAIWNGMGGSFHFSTTYN